MPVPLSTSAHVGCVQQNHNLPTAFCRRGRSVISSSTQNESYYWGCDPCDPYGLSRTVGVLGIGGVWGRILGLNSVFGCVGACQVGGMR